MKEETWNITCFSLVVHVKSEVPKPIVKSSAIKRFLFFFFFQKNKKKETNFIVANIKIASKNGKVNYNLERVPQGTFLSLKGLSKKIYFL